MGCATYHLILTADEQCALRGMKLTGFTFGGSSTQAYDDHGERAEGYSRSDSYSCEVPRTARDRCGVAAFQRSAMAKSRVNDESAAYTRKKMRRLNTEIEADANDALDACR